MTKNESKLVDALMRHCFSCPIKDDSIMDFEKECVGYREPGCGECIINHIDDLN